MKKFVLGIILCVIGMAFSLVCFIHALLNPVIYNGASGLIESFIGNGTSTAFLISLSILLIGVIICIYEAYKK